MLTITNGANFLNTYFLQLIGIVSKFFSSNEFKK